MQTSNIGQTHKQKEGYRFKGNFEQFVLLTVAVLQDDAYGVKIKHEMEQRMKCQLSVGSIQSAMKRMEEKGFLTSYFGEASPVRGKRKRIFQLTSYAHKVLNALKDIRDRYWDGLPDFSI